MATGLVLILVGLAIVLRAVQGKLPDQLTRLVDREGASTSSGASDAHDRSDVGSSGGEWAPTRPGGRLPLPLVPAIPFPEEIPLPEDREVSWSIEDEAALDNELARVWGE